MLLPTYRTTRCNVLGDHIEFAPYETCTTFIHFSHCVKAFFVAIVSCIAQVNGGRWRTEAVALLVNRLASGDLLQGVKDGPHRNRPLQQFFLAEGTSTELLPNNNRKIQTPTDI
jgi:hypothetical protein